MLDFIDTLAKSLSANWVALTALFFAVGVCKVYIYYKCFGFSIVGFYSVQEVASLLTDNLLAFGVILVGAFITVYYGVVKSEALRDDDLIRYVWHNRVLFVIVFACWVVSTGYYLLRRRIHTYEWIVMLFLSIVLFAIVPFMLAQEYQADGASYTVEALFLANVAIVAIVTTSALTFTEYHKVKRLGHYSNVVLTIDGKEVKCGDDLLFVGRLQNYVILHSKTEKQAIVIPASKVSEYRFPA